MARVISVNEGAHRLVKELVDRAADYGVRVTRSASGATIVDVGIRARGGLQAGRLLTEICMGGYGTAALAHVDYQALCLPAISVATDHPAIALLGAQFAGWRIKVGKYFAMGSGPARALARVEKGLYERLEYEDEADVGVIVLETYKEPPDDVCVYVADRCGIDPEGLYVIACPTGCAAGVVQISGRIVETGIHKLSELGLDPKRVLHGYGYAPIAPVHPSFVTAMGRTNDMLLYGGVTGYVVDHEDDDELRDIVSKAPSSASKDYGRPFCEVFEAAGRDFYKIDPSLFAPAVVSVTSARTGRTFTAGRVDVEILRRSIGL